MTRADAAARPAEPPAPRPAASAADWGLAARRPWMARETKIALAVIAGLMASFGYVLYKKWDERETQTAAARRAAQEQDVAAAASLGGAPGVSLAGGDPFAGEADLSAGQEEPELGSGIADFEPDIRRTGFTEGEAARGRDSVLHRRPADDAGLESARGADAGRAAVRSAEPADAPRRFSLALDEDEPVAARVPRRLSSEAEPSSNAATVEERPSRSARGLGGVEPLFGAPQPTAAAEPARGGPAIRPPEGQLDAGARPASDDPFQTPTTTAAATVSETEGVTPVAGEAAAEGGAGASSGVGNEDVGDPFGAPATGGRAAAAERTEGERPGRLRPSSPAIRGGSPAGDPRGAAFPEPADRFAEPVRVEPAPRGLDGDDAPRRRLRPEPEPAEGFGLPVESAPSRRLEPSPETGVFESSSDASSSSPLITPRTTAGSASFGSSVRRAEPAVPAADDQLDASHTHKVAAGDNYWSIAQRVYGAGGYANALQEYNQERIPDPKRMRPGMIVVTPPVEVLRGKHASALPPHLRGDRGGLSGGNEILPSGFFLNEAGAPQYRVGKGDVLSDIAHEHLGRSSRWIQIYELNRDRVPNPNDLKIGTVLRLPADASRVQLVREPTEYR